MSDTITTVELHSTEYPRPWVAVELTPSVAVDRLLRAHHFACRDVEAWLRDVADWHDHVIGGMHVCTGYLCWAISCGRTSLAVERARKANVAVIVQLDAAVAEVDRITELIEMVAAGSHVARCVGDGWTVIPREAEPRLFEVEGVVDDGR